jgi:hypothetical protein
MINNFKKSLLPEGKKITVNTMSDTNPNYIQRQETAEECSSGLVARHSVNWLKGCANVVMGRAGQLIAWCVTKVSQSPEGFFALSMTLLFYYPSLRNGSRDAGFLYGGDVLGFYWPYLAKLHALLSRHQFVALDFSQFNANADFFLAANFFNCHPLFVLWSLCTSPENVTFQATGQMLVLALALHSFISCFFTLRLLTRFFHFNFWAAAFAASAFAFSVYAIDSHLEPMYIFCNSVVPWAAYAALDYEERRGGRRLIFAAFPILMGYLAGYVPLGIACLGMSVLLVGVKLFLLDDSTSTLAVRSARFIAALLPFTLGSIVAAPYLLEVFFFLKASPSKSTASLFFSAHQLAEVPQSILRALSYRAGITGPFHEFSVTWGFIAIAVAALFLLTKRTLDSLTFGEWTTMKAAGFIYSAIVLSIFGQYSVVSDLVFYFIPQVGGMHIYQRFLLPGQLFFAVMIALMLKAVIDARPVLGLRVSLAMFATAIFTVAFCVLHYPSRAASVGFNNYIVFELLLAAICMAALLAHGKTFAYIATIGLFTLPALGLMYERSQGISTFDEQVKRQGVMLDKTLRKGVMEYLERFHAAGKKLIKYVDITPRWNKDGIETFPKAFPDFVLGELRLCPYSGFNFYLSTRADYMATIPYAGDGRFHPDWERLNSSGADFVVALEDDLPKLEPMTGRLGPQDIYRLPGGVVLAPLASSGLHGSLGEDVVFDNGYVRILRGRGDGMGAFINNLALHAAARQSSDGCGVAALAVDGNTSGVFSEGSVTHTKNEPGAWLEIDLGKSQPIGSVRLWNRKECSYRLSDYWLTISDKPASAGQQKVHLEEKVTPGFWQKRITITPHPSLTIATSGAVGRYIRVQLARQMEDPDNNLSLAEMQAFPPVPVGPAYSGCVDGKGSFLIHSFSSNDANRITLDVETKEPSTVEYLLWNNPRLRYQLDDKTAVPSVRDGLAGIEIPPGRHKVTITYHNHLLMLFWFGYLSYAVLALWAIASNAWEEARARKQRKGAAPIV